MGLHVELRRQLTAGRSKSILLAVVSALLSGLLLIYTQSIRSYEQTLSQLGDKLPVTGQVVSLDGTNSSGIVIPHGIVEKLEQADVCHMRYTVAAAGMLENDPQDTEPFSGGDTTVLGINCPEALPYPDLAIEFSPEFSAEIFTQDNPVCVVSEDCLQQHGLTVGDTITLPLYLDMQTSYAQISERSAMTIVGSFQGDAYEDLVAPAAWLKKEAEENGDLIFCYSSCAFQLSDPIHLNDFAEQAESAGLVPVDRAGNDFLFGGALVLKDELFTKSAVPLQRNLNICRRSLPFLLPGVTAIMILVVFLCLRSGRREMAVALSLGCSRRKLFAAFFLSVLLFVAAGCLLTTAVFLVAVRMSFAVCLTALSAFLGSACIGTACALFFLFRCDVMVLLAVRD